MTAYIKETDAGSKICPHLPVDTEAETLSDGRTVTRVINFAVCWGARCAMWRPGLRRHGVPGRVMTDDSVGYCGMGDAPYRDE